MDESGFNAHSFVMKIWLEEFFDKALDPIPSQEQQPLWRGRVTHVLSGETQYFTELSEAMVFIQTYQERTVEALCNTATNKS